MSISNSKYLASKTILTVFSLTLLFASFYTYGVALADAQSIEDSGVSLNETSGTTSVWFAVSLAGLSVALLVSVAVSFYLYRWRRILLSSPHMLVPEELGKRLLSYEKALHQLQGSHVEATKALGSRSESVAGKLEDMIETFMTLQNAIDQKDAEINRYKSGHDLEIFKRYLFRFVRIHQTMLDIESEGVFGSDELSLLKRLLEDAMDECGVEEFSPELGADIREVEGVADNPKKVSATQGQKDFQIVEVRETGYRCRTTADQYEIVVPSKVTIAISEKGD